MNLFTGALLGIVTIFGCNTVKKTTEMDRNILSVQEKLDGWELLFDGKSMAGWHSYGKQSPGNAWRPDDVALHLDAASKKTAGVEGGDLVTNDEYENFHLKLEWKVAPNGNSGIIFYVKEDAAKYANTYNTGPEMQVLDNAGHPDAKIIKHRAGDLYDLISAKETVKPAGEWNAAEIISNQGDLQFFLNGERVLQTTMWNDAWTAMIAGSKFKDMPGFGTFRKGRIALQDHGDDVWYRNIRIKRL